MFISRKTKTSLCFFELNHISVIQWKFKAVKNPLICFSAAVNAEGKEIFLRDIWPTREETQAVEKTFVIPSMFKEVYEKIEVMGS